MKKQLMLLVTSALLLSGCNQTNSVLKQFRKKVGSSTSYSEFMASYSDALADLQSGEFWDLISNDKPKSCVITMQEVSEAEQTHTTNKVTSKEEQYVSMSIKGRYDENSKNAYSKSEIVQKNKEYNNKKLVYVQDSKDIEEQYQGENVTIDVSDKTYKLETNNTASFVTGAVGQFMSMTSSVASMPEIDGAKMYINNKLYTVEYDITLRDLEGYESDDKVNCKVQVNLDPNDLFFFSAMTGKNLSYKVGDTEVKIKKATEATAFSIKSKDVKVKLPSLDKFVSEDIVTVS